MIRPGWRLWRALGLRTRSADSRERTLGTFAPLIVVVLLVLWLSGLILGFGFIFYGLRDYVRPSIDGFQTALYFAGTSVLRPGRQAAVAGRSLFRKLLSRSFCGPEKGGGPDVANRLVVDDNPQSVAPGVPFARALPAGSGDET